MTKEKFEALYEHRENAMVRLFHAWVATRTEGAGDDAYEELKNAADALTLVHAAMNSVHH
jgi:hypothetical protein